MANAHLAFYAGWSAVMQARGNLQNPLSDADLEAKLREGARRSLIDADRLIPLVWSLDQAESVSALMPATKPDRSQQEERR